MSNSTVLTSSWISLSEFPSKSARSCTEELSEELDFVSSTSGVGDKLYLTRTLLRNLIKSKLSSMTYGSFVLIF